jgi:hypothetical protein
MIRREVRFRDAGVGASRRTRFMPIRKSAQASAFLVPNPLCLPEGLALYE